MVFPKPFQHPPSTIASFDFVDIAAGFGIINYFGVVNEQDTAQTFTLITETYPSINVETALPDTNTLTFDSLVFNLPKTIKGTAFLVVPLNYPSGAGNGGVKLKLQHYDGTTATDITAEILSFDAVSGGSAFDQTFTKMPITVEKQFKKGDILRLLITAVSGGSAVTVAHSATNQTGSKTGNTQLIVGVPFQIDI